MYRQLLVVVVALALPSCRIAPTPREYIDRQPPADEVRREAEAAVREQLLSLFRALEAGDAEAARRAIAPAPTALLIGPGQGDRFTGDDQIEALTDLIATQAGADLEMSELIVAVDRQASAAWFAAWLDTRLDRPLHLRLSGVFVLREGRWELVQAHLSIPSEPLTAPQPRLPAG